MGIWALEESVAGALRGAAMGLIYLACEVFLLEIAGIVRSVDRNELFGSGSWMYAQNPA